MPSWKQYKEAIEKRDTSVIVEGIRPFANTPAPDEMAALVQALRNLDTETIAGMMFTFAQQVRDLGGVSVVVFGEILDGDEAWAEFDPDTDDIREYAQRYGLRYDEEGGEYKIVGDPLYQHDLDALMSEACAAGLSTDHIDQELAGRDFESLPYAEQRWIIESLEKLLAGEG